jgi:hypothetical protein
MNEQENKNLFDIGYGYDALVRLTLKNRPLPVNAGIGITGTVPLIPGKGTYSGVTPLCPFDLPTCFVN